jgi:hypothetical protein
MSSFINDQPTSVLDQGELGEAPVNPKEDLRLGTKLVFNGSTYRVPLPLPPPERVCREDDRSDPSRSRASCSWRLSRRYQVRMITIAKEEMTEREMMAALVAL